MRSWLSQRFPLAGSLTVIALLLIAGTAAASLPAQAQTPPQPDTDNTVTRIHVYPNGTAQWTIQIRTRLDTDQRVNEYTAFQARFRNDTGRYLTPFKNRMQGVIAAAANATDRDMNATAFHASTRIQEVPRRWGIVTFSFTWTRFAATEDGGLVVGDVFQGGFFLAANDTLKIESPTGYQITEVAPPPDNHEAGVVTWTGRKDFDNRRPHVRFTPTEQATQPTPASPTPRQGKAPDNAQQPPETGPGLPLLAGGAILVTLIGLGAYLLIGKRGQIPLFGAWMQRGDSDADAAGTRTDDASAAGIVTDEEQVQQLLQTHGGRMRQADIAEELAWSASKTSRVIARMVEDGAVKKLQLGRENVIDLQEPRE